MAWYDPRDWDISWGYDAGEEFKEQTEQIQEHEERDTTVKANNLADISLGPAAESAAANYARALDLYRQAGDIQSRVPIRDTTPIVAERVAVPDIYSAGRGEGAHRADVTGITGRTVAGGPDVSLSRIAPVERIDTFGELNSQDVGQIALQRAQVDASAGKMLRDAASGKAPSASEAAMRYALDQASKRRLSMAAGARGSDRAGARREAMLMIGEDAAGIGNQAASARAAEMATARGQFSQFAMQSAALEAEQNRTQAELDRAIAQGNQAQANALRVKTAELEAERKRINAAAENQRASEQQGRALQTDLANRATNIDVATGNAARAQAADAFTAGAKNAAAESYAQRQDESDQAYLQRLQALYNQQAGMQLTAAQANAQNALQAQIQTAAQRLARDQAASAQDLQGQALRFDSLTGAQSAAQAAAGTQTTIGASKLGVVSGQVAAERERAYYEQQLAEQGRQKLGGQIVGGIVGAIAGGPPGAVAGAQTGGAIAGGSPPPKPPPGTVTPTEQPVYFARGGVVSGPQHAIIGEAGPEAVIPLVPRPGAAEELAATLRRAPGDPQLSRDLAAAMSAAALRARKERRVA